MVPSDRFRTPETTNDLRTEPKAYAYVTRPGPEPRLLVFRQRPVSAGTEIPKGGIEPGETPREAVLRETREETGLSELAVVEKLSSDYWRHRTKPKRYHRHFFHLRADPDRERWRHTVTGTDSDAGEVYECFWSDPAEVDLIRGMDEYLALLALGRR
jgi:8-oxo-dGTP pyrophosphatase MutT (NUDIX family)